MSLEEALLADLEGLSDYDEPSAGGSDDEREAEAPTHNAMDTDGSPDETTHEQQPRTRLSGSVHAVAKLTRSGNYKRVLDEIRAALTRSAALEAAPPTSLDPRQAMAHRFSADGEEELVASANNLVTDIDDETVLVYQYIRDQYHPIFPDLETLVTHPLDYIKTVQAIVGVEDITSVNLKAILPSSVAMVVTVTATTIKRVRPSEAELARIREACDMVDELQASRSLITGYIESRLNIIAPNLSAVIGTATAAQILSVTGGLAGLCRMPACNLLVLGSKQHRQTGLSRLPSQNRQGFIYNSPSVMTLPPDLRTKAVRMFSAKCVLAARVDLTHRTKDGAMGRSMRDEIDGKLKVLREPPQSKKVKALPAPREAPRKRRGGRRARKAKESKAMTELRKQQNRLAFGEAEEEADYIGEEIVGLGMAGSNSRNARVIAADERVKINLPKKYRHISGIATAAHPSSGLATSGLTTSLAFTQNQGLELQNPDAAKAPSAAQSLADKYFSSSRIPRS
ncbi:U4/U6-U5 snRNP complex subunit prp31 [Tieghemiomyces parasiticus]|uniref:U4/U6-U5 snRNP complex subunit prp31 n=1 Tax=Tieghemiomyces parasiticus TaxID=78921 RepID=A0A9W8A113_9FUNG|nr:U4/U6-U5 snRNP complex subunit prp31 [Tieghemiomyces parasiticus]